MPECDDAVCYGWQQYIIYSFMSRWHWSCEWLDLLQSATLNFLPTLNKKHEWTLTGGNVQQNLFYVITRNVNFVKLKQSLTRIQVKAKNYYFRNPAEEDNQPRRLKHPDCCILVREHRQISGMEKRTELFDRDEQRNHQDYIKTHKTPSQSGIASRFDAGELLPLSQTVVCPLTCTLTYNWQERLLSELPNIWR